MSWWKKPEVMCAGSALFRGSMPPRADNFDYLTKRGCTLVPEECGESEHWRLQISHPKWGSASAHCLRGMPPVPTVLVDMDPRLSDEEKQQAKLGHSAVTVRMTSQEGNILRDRKRLLWFLQALMGDDGVVVVDHTAQAFWSRCALDEELQHDADLNVEAIYSLHSVTNSDGRVYWMHSHGLKELGFFDFDILDPYPDNYDVGLYAVIALAIVEGKSTLGGPPCEIVGGAPPVVLVPSKAFRAEQGRKYPSWAEDLDEEHADGHGVVCMPPSKGLFGLLRRPPEIWPLFCQELPEDLPILYSNASTDLMALRARATWSVLCSMREEFAEFDLPCLVKMRGNPDSSEHLWFEVTGCRDNEVEATLLNDPWNDIGLSKGDKVKRDLELLTDWTIMTPVGRISPRSVVAARILRTNYDEIKTALAASQ